MERLHFPDAEKLTLKAFRSGMATQMALDGEDPIAIMKAGEWSGKVHKRYVHNKTIDAVRAVEFITAESDEE